MQINAIEIPQKILTAGLSDELLRLDRFLIKHRVSESRDRIKLIIEKGGVLLNDRLVTFPSKKIRNSDKIYVRRLFLADYYGEQELSIIHQDEDIIVISKPSGFLTLPDQNSTIPSVISQLKRTVKGDNKNIFPVHRLDKDTSGVMIFARNPKASEFLKSQFEEKKIEKKYIALLQGNLESDAGTIRGTMRASGEFGESNYRVVERFKYATLVEVSPKTGRTNQIRIQFSERGHPLIGEYKYLRTSRGVCIIFPRVALHSQSIRFIHPLNKKEVTFTAMVPDDLKLLTDFLKNQH
jgi:23S rRNA pseudouridine1911/1915/1917 synthase